MKEYMGKAILKQISARLVPSSNTLPDCICEILITGDTLYVLEDEYNGEYTVHYAIPCDHIERIEKCRNSKDSNISGDMLTPLKYALTAFIGIIGGVIFLPSRNGLVNNGYIEYMRVIYSDETGKKCELYFNEVTGNIKRFSKAFSNR